VQGVLATNKGYLKENYPIIWSPDKDMKTIPGAHIGKDGNEYTITPEEAWKFFLMQCIAGDTTDGVPGAPGFGMKTAEEYLDTYGPTWGTVLMAYSESWTPAATALMYARAVRILHSTDYRDGKVILWTP
jgi:hypothetical protein